MHNAKQTKSQIIALVPMPVSGVITLLKKIKGLSTSYLGVQVGLEYFTNPGQPKKFPWKKNE